VFVDRSKWNFSGARVYGNPGGLVYRREDVVFLGMEGSNNYAPLHIPLRFEN